MSMRARLLSRQAALIQLACQKVRNGSLPRKHWRARLTLDEGPRFLTLHFLMPRFTIRLGLKSKSEKLKACTAVTGLIPDVALRQGWSGRAVDFGRRG